VKLKTAFLLIFWSFLKPLTAQSLTDLRLIWSDFAQTSGYSGVQIGEVDRFLNRLEKHQNRLQEKSEIERAKWLYVQAKAKFFVSYKDEANFSGTIQHGTFNCLTGTTLLASLFRYFEIQHQIIETNHHIFILIDGAEKVLVEVTDPNGFIANKKEIEMRLERYQQNTQFAGANDDDKKMYRYTFNLWESISLEDLKGRLFYNEAVKSFNHKNLGLSINQLAQAEACSYSERYSELAQILSLSVKLNETLEEEKKFQLLLQLKNISRKNAAYALSAN
jgi:hypothetical protein